MTLSKSTGTMRARAQILTVDTANRRIEGLMKDKSTAQIAVWDDAGNAFRWPQENEIWMIQQYTGVWRLVCRVQQGQIVSSSQSTPELVPIETMAPGQMKLDATDIINDAGTPIGPQPGDLIPSAARTRAGCLLCDGAAYTLSVHPELERLATACPDYVSGGVLTVPDLRGRVPMGAGTGTAAGATPHALGSQPTSGPGGEQTHLQVAAEAAVNGNGVTGNDTPDHTHGSPFPLIQVNEAGAYSYTTVFQSGVSNHTITNIYGLNGASARHAHPLTARNADSAASILPPVSVVNWFVQT